jgi:DNA polymerase-3 subunit beta
MDALIKVSAECDADFEGGEPFLIPAAPAVAFAKRSNGNVSVFVNRDNSTAVMGAGRASLTLRTLPAKEWPELTAKGIPSSFSVNTDDFIGAIGNVARAAEINGSRLYLHGVYMHSAASRDGLMLVAVDGHRMSIRRLSVEMQSTPRGVILPTQLVLMLPRLAASKRMDVSVYDNCVRFACGDVEILSKVVDGDFPDYARLKPNLAKNRFSVDADDFLLALSRMQILTEKQSKAMRLEIGDDGDLVISFSNDGLGKSTEVLPTQGWTGGQLVFGANATYLASAAKGYAGGILTFAIDTNASPIRIQGGLVERLDWENNLEVVMPLRVAA